MAMGMTMLVSKSNPRRSPCCPIDQISFIMLMVVVMVSSPNCGHGCVSTCRVTGRSLGLSIMFVVSPAIYP